MQKTIFFAYASGHSENIDAIKRGVIEYNGHQKSYHVRLWEDLSIDGVKISQKIFDAIDGCELFACDLTYLNHNVLFELGYAIAKKKSLLIFLNETVKDAKTNYSNFKILKDIGYTKFVNSKDITAAFQSRKNDGSSLLTSIFNTDSVPDNIHEVFFINSKIENQATLDLYDYFNDQNYSVITNNTSEVEYQTLLWYITNIYKVQSIIVHMVSYEKSGYESFNAELSLYAGLGLGLGKSVLFLAPKPFAAPIDYSDILMEYENSKECINKTNTWLQRRFPRKLGLLSKYSLPKYDNDIETKKTNLLKLGIGCEVAEAEEEGLLQYFIELESFQNLYKSESSLIVGRKGSGKSALFIKTYFDHSSQHDSYIIVLKPDSEDLLDQVEFTMLYENERSKKTFLYTVWQFVIYSKLLGCCVKSIQEKKLEFTKTEVELLEFYNAKTNFLNLNFYGAIKYICEDSGKTVYDPDILSPIKNNYITPLVKILRTYFSFNKYKKIEILADNLDKAWDSKNDLHLQSEMILSLLEYCGKIKHELGQSSLQTFTLLFLRKDIFDFIQTTSREPDKVLIKTIFIDWSKYPIKLRELIEARFRYSLGLGFSADISSIWEEYFNFEKKIHPFERILSAVVLRPRDIIYFISKMFEFAVNSNLAIVNEDCYKYAIDAYSQFLHSNLIAEMKAEYPVIESIMTAIQSKQRYNERIDYHTFLGVIKNETKEIDVAKKIIESLFGKQYIVGVNEKSFELYRTHEELQIALKAKRFFLFANKISMILYPRSGLLND